MEYKTILQLLDKYWEGNTSLSEEDMLRKYFSEQEVADDLKAYQPLFQHFAQAKSTQLSSDFDTKILQQIQQEEDDSQKEAKVRPMYSPMLRIAAGFAIILGSFFFINKNIGPSGTVATAIVYDENNPEDVKEAFIAFQAALQLASGKMNNGTKKASAGLHKIKEVTNIIK